MSRRRNLKATRLYKLPNPLWGFKWPLLVYTLDYLDLRYAVRVSLMYGWGVGSGVGVRMGSGEWSGSTDGEGGVGGGVRVGSGEWEGEYGWVGGSGEWEGGVGVRMGSGEWGVEWGVGSGVGG